MSSTEINEITLRNGNLGEHFPGFFKKRFSVQEARVRGCFPNHAVTSMMGV